MSTAELIKLAPFAVALASLAATGLLGYADYALSRDRSRLDLGQDHPARYLFAAWRLLMW